MGKPGSVRPGKAPVGLNADHVVMPFCVPSIHEREAMPAALAKVGGMKERVWGGASKGTTWRSGRKESILGMYVLTE